VSSKLAAGAGSAETPAKIAASTAMTAKRFKVFSSPESLRNCAKVAELYDGA
jgi:hypothetical protein